MTDLNVSLVIKAVDRATGPIRRLGGQLSQLSRRSGLDRVSAQAGKTGHALGRLGRETGAFAAKTTAAAGIVGYAFKHMFLDTASEFERFRTILQTTEGSAAGAKKAMAWVSKFATKTPFELAQVTDAYKQLRVQGLDPTNGLLKTLGDTSAAMGVPLMQSVMAINDAVTGENERLKELGVTASVKGHQTTYTYMDKHNKQHSKTVDNRNRKMIVSTLKAIWNEKYAGSMDKLSKTWDGMMSNISDQWTRFANMVMNAGLFDWMKNKLGGVLDRINAMADSGQLQALAKQIGTNLKAAFVSLWQAGKQFVALLRELGHMLGWLHDLFGSWKPIIIGVAAIMAGPLLMAIGSAATAVYGLGAALMATPVGWIMAAVAAIAGAVYLIYRNWDAIAQWFTAKFEAVKTAFSSGFLQGMVELIHQFDPFMLLLDGLNSLIKAVTGFDLAAALKAKMQGVGQWFTAKFNAIKAMFKGGFLQGMVKLAQQFNPFDSLLGGLNHLIHAVTGFDLAGMLKAKVAAMTDILPDWIKDKLGITSKPAAPTRTIDPGAGRAEVGGLVRVEVSGEGRPKVREAKGHGGVQMEAETYHAWEGAR